MLVTIEDGQWLDDASADVIRSLGPHLRRHPWIICVTTRQVDESRLSDDAIVLDLAGLDGGEAAQLAEEATDQAPLASQELALIVERSGGNPLFLQELLAGSRDAGAVEQLPDSIESLMTARIDRLPATERTVLRHLSVLGQSFPVDLAADVLPELRGDEGVWDRLAEFLAHDGATVRFRHALVRDVAYDGLQYRSRRRLHDAAGTVIAEAPDAGRKERAGLLSFHFFHARRLRDAWSYALTAADHARSVYANAEAVLYLERALAAARGLDELPDGELARVHEELGDVQDRMGKYREAEAAYRRARRLLPPDPVGEARLMLKQAQQHGWLNRYSQSKRWIGRALRLLDDHHGVAAARQRADLKAWYARFCEEEGRHRLSLRWCERAADEAEGVGDEQVLAFAHRTAGRALGHLGEVEEAAARWSLALSLYERLEDLPGQGAMVNNLGVFAYWEGEWSAAREYYEQSRSICQRIGDEVGVAMAEYNMGHLLCEQGHTDEAAPVLFSSLRIFRAAGHVAGAAASQRELARVAANQGRHAEALEQLETVRQAFHQAGSPVEEIDTAVTVAECELLRERPDLALTAVDEALQQDVALGGVSAQSPVLHRLRGYALLALGDVAGAAKALEASLDAGRSRDMIYEVAATLHALSELAEISGAFPMGRSSGLLRRESQDILDRLGVVRLPDYIGRTARARAAAR